MEMIFRRIEFWIEGNGITQKQRERKGDTNDIIWRSYRRVPVAKLPYQQRHWVLDRGSLTKRLIRASQGDFKVEISRQVWALPSLDERRLLKLPLGQRALIRDRAFK